MLWVLKRTISMSSCFDHPKHVFTVLTSESVNNNKFTPKNSHIWTYGFNSVFFLFQVNAWTREEEEMASKLFKFYAYRRDLIIVFNPYHAQYFIYYNCKFGNFRESFIFAKLRICEVS